MNKYHNDPVKFDFLSTSVFTIKFFHLTTFDFFHHLSRSFWQKFWWDEIAFSAGNILQLFIATRKNDAKQPLVAPMANTANAFLIKTKNIKVYLVLLSVMDVFSIKLSLPKI